MKKIISDPKNYIKEMLKGIYITHPDKIAYVNDDLQCLINAHNEEGKVGIAARGESSHLPLFPGYVSSSTLDGYCVGDVF